MKKSKYKFLEPFTRRPTQRFYLAGVGAYEWMPECIVNRPKGTWDWLFMYFHTPITIMVEGKIQQFPADTLIIWDEEASHYYGNPEKEWCHSWIHCQGHIVHEFLEGSGLKAGVYPGIDISGILETYFSLIYKERTRRQGIDWVIIENHFQCFLRETGRKYSPKELFMSPGIQKVKQHLETDFRNRISLDELCKIAAISKPHLICEFRKSLDTSPIDYLIKVRMDHARHLLLNRNLSVSEVALEVGYTDHFHFSKIFKKHVGEPPTEFRKHYKII